MSDNIIQLNEDLIKHDLKDLVCSSVEETMIKMYLAAFPVRRVEDITSDSVEKNFNCIVIKSN